MGFEYRVPLQMQSVSPEIWHERLCAAPYFSRIEPLYRFYEYRSRANINFHNPPDVAVKVEQHGLYICDNGGSQKVFVAIKSYLQDVVTSQGELFCLEEYEQ